MAAKSFMGRRVVFWGVVGVLVATAVLVWTLRRGGEGPGASVAEESREEAAEAAQPAEKPIDNVDIDIAEETLNLSDPEMEAQAEASLRVPPHDWRTELVKGVANESVEECVANLGNFDDNSLADSSFSGLHGGTAPFYARKVTRLVRVQRLMEIGRKDPEAVLPILKRYLAQSVDTWPSAVAQLGKALSEQGGVRSKETDPWAQCEGRILGATYLLAELGAHDALPDILRSCKGPDWPLRTGSILPPAYTLYAMHRLVESFPEDRLSPEVSLARQQYLEAASCLGDVEKVVVTAWSAKYDANDPRIQIIDPQGSIVEGQPKMEMAVYPHLYKDGTQIGEGSRIQEKARNIFSLLERFINAAFPDQDS